MHFKKIVMLGVATLSLDTLDPTLAHPVDIHATAVATHTTAILTRFRHNWHGYSFGTFYILKVHKYYAGFDQRHDGDSQFHNQDYWQQIYYMPSSKNTYTGLTHNSTNRPFSITCTSNHKMYLPQENGKVHMTRIK